MLKKYDSSYFSLLLALYILLVPLEDILKIEELGTLNKLIAGLLIGIIAFSICRENEFKYDHTQLAGTCFIMWCFASLMWVPDRGAAMQSFITLVLLVVFTLAAPYHGFSKQQMALFFLAAIIGGLITDWKIFTSDVTAFNNETTFRTSIGDEVDPNHLASSLLLPLAAAIHGIFDQANNKWKKMIYGLLFCVFMQGFLALGSRGAFMSIIAMVVLYLLLNKRFKALFCFGVAIASVLIYFWDDPYSRLSATNALGSGGAGRTNIWVVASSILQDKWLIGGGIASFPYLYNMYALSTVIGYSQGIFRAAHNNFAMITCELGIIGLVWFVLLSGSILWNGKYREKKTLTLFCVFVGLLVTSLFLDTLYRKYYWLVLMLIYGQTRYKMFNNGACLDEDSNDIPSVSQQSEY